MYLKMLTRSATVAGLLLSLMALGCGTTHSSITNPTSTAQINHVVVVVLENHSYSEVIGNSGMPYLNKLASTYGLATQYYGDTHPSIGNYFMLTTGQIITNDETSPPATVNADNIVRELVSSGKTWKSYAEGLPSVGYLGGDVYPYAQHHNPFVFLSDVQSSAAQQHNVVPFSQFSVDLAGNQLPNFSFVVPNQFDNAHDGSLTQADSWLNQNIAPLVSSSLFQKDGLLIILFDESDFTDLANVGGHTVAVVVSPFAKKNYQSTTLYQHQNTLHFVLSSLGVPNYPGLSAVAQNMSEFLQ